MNQTNESKTMAAMNRSRRRLLGSAARLTGAGALLSLSDLAAAQTAAWPSKNIQIITPAPAGGGVDAAARKLAEMLAPIFGVPIVAMNRPGAAGLLGAQVLASSAPDGHTVGYLHSGHIVLQAMEGKPNMLTEFTPLGLFSTSMFCIAVAADSPYRTLEALLTAIEKSPGKFNYGAGGNGSPGHIAWEKLALMRPMKVTQVPYKGAAESVMAVAQKDIDFVSGVFSSVLAIARTGKVRILAVTGRERSTIEPDLPTVAQAANLPGYSHESWGGLFGPAQVPDTIVAQWDAAIRRVANDAGFKKFIIENGGQPAVSQSPAALATMLKSELNETTQLLTRLGLRKV